MKEGRGRRGEGNQREGAELTHIRRSLTRLPIQLDIRGDPAFVIVIPEGCTRAVEL